MPKARVVGFAVTAPATTAVPDIETFNGELDASETIESVPVGDPAEVGDNDAVNVTLWFGFSVAGRARPLIENPVPLTFACEIVTAEAPVFVRVSERLLWLPTTTVPNAKVAGFAESVPGVTPFPANGMTT